MAIHANSTRAPERTLLRKAAAPGRLLSTRLRHRDREAELLAILDAGPIGPEALAGLSRQRRRAAQHGIDALIAYLDAIDGDPDLEPNMSFVMPGEVDEAEPDADEETSLGAPENHHRQALWARGGDDDLERDTSDLEPSLGSCNPVPPRLGVASISRGRALERWPMADHLAFAHGGSDDLEEVDEHGDDLDRGEEEHDGRESDADEPSLGSLHCIDQRLWSHGLTSDCEVDWENEADERSGSGFMEGECLLRAA